VDIENIHRRFHGRGEAVGAPDNQAHRSTFFGQNGQIVFRGVLKAGIVFLVRARQTDQLWMPCMLWPFARTSAPVRSEWAMPWPAVIQFTSPGTITCALPRLSR